MKKEFVTYCLLLLAWCGTASGQKLSPAQQLADFDTLCSRLERVHPNPYLYQSRKQYEKHKNMTRASLTDTVSASGFYLRIAPFMAKMKDGHSMMLPPLSDYITSHSGKDGKAMPLRLKAAGNVFVVDYPVTAHSKIGEGDTILSINGINSKDILKRMYRLWGAEKDNGIKESSVSSCLPSLFWYMYKWSGSYVFKVKHGDKTEETRMEEVPQGMAQKVLKERLSMKKPESFSCEFSPDYAKATLTIRNVYQEKELTEFCDSVFGEINRRKIPEIIIDMRNNSGGSSQCVEKLISYFPHPAYTLYARSEIKVSPYSKAYNKERHPEIYSQIRDLPDGELFTIKGTPTKANKDDTDLYHGKTTILVNNKTYSGASTFAHTMEKLGIAHVEGETGCPDVYFGNYLRFTLPNSKIDYYITFAQFHE